LSKSWAQAYPFPRSLGPPPHNHSAFQSVPDPLLSGYAAGLGIALIEGIVTQMESTMSYLTFLMFLWVLPLPVLGALVLVERVKRSDK